MRLRDRVGAHAKKQIEKHRRSPSWLNEGVEFNHNLLMVEKEKFKLKTLLEDIKVSKRRENYKNMELLISNLLFQGEKRPVVISLNVNDWKLSRYVKAGQGIIKIVNKLFEFGYINLNMNQENHEFGQLRNYLVYFQDTNIQLVINQLKLLN